MDRRGFLKSLIAVPAIGVGAVPLMQAAERGFTEPKAYWGPSGLRSLKIPVPQVVRLGHGWNGAEESSDVETSEKFDGLAVRYNTGGGTKSIWLIQCDPEEGRVNSLVPIE